MRGIQRAGSCESELNFITTTDYANVRDVFWCCRNYCWLATRCSVGIVQCLIDLW